MAKRSTQMARPNFKAAITKRQMYAGEKAAQKWGVTRRIAYGVLTRSAAQLLAGMDDKVGELWLDEIENISKYLEWRKHETELLKTAQARLFAVLQAAFPEPEAKGGDAPPTRPS